MSKKFIIFKGEDRNIPLDLVRITHSGIRRPYKLTGWTKITIQLRQSSGKLLSLDTIPAHGIKSSGVYEDVTYTATNVGVLGDSISLVFDGSDSIATVVSNWNTMNPANTVEHDASDDSVIPSAGTLNLADGLDDYAKVTVLDEAEGKIQVRVDNEDTNSLKNGPSGSITAVIDFGDHSAGVRRIASAKNVLDVKSSLP